jgi:hypothetical protein
MHVRHLADRLVRLLGWLGRLLCQLWGCQKLNTEALPREGTRGHFLGVSTGFYGPPCGSPSVC